MSATYMAEHEPIAPLAAIIGSGGVVGLVALFFKRWKGQPAAQDELNEGWRTLMEQMRLELKAAHTERTTATARLETVKAEYAAERRELHSEMGLLRRRVEELTREISALRGGT